MNLRKSLQDLFKAVALHSNVEPALGYSGPEKDQFITGLINSGKLILMLLIIGEIFNRSPNLSVLNIKIFFIFFKLKTF